MRVEVPAVYMSGAVAVGAAAGHGAIVRVDFFDLIQNGRWHVSH